MVIEDDQEEATPATVKDNNKQDDGEQDDYDSEEGEAGQNKELMDKLRKAN